MKIYILLLSILLLSFNVCYSQEILLEWKYEEGAGTVVLDSSQNNNYGIISDNNKYRPSDCAFGNYCLDFDNSDYVQSVTSTEISNQITFSVWVYYENNDQINTILSIIDFSLNERFNFYYDDSGVSDTFELIYLDNNSIQRTIILENIDEVNIKDTWQNLILSIDRETNNVFFYRDGNLIYNETQNYTFSTAQTTNILKVGMDSNNLVGFKGWFDNTHILNFIPNSSQIIELINNGIFTTPLIPSEEEEEEENETQIDIMEQIIIINNTLPIQDSNITNLINIIITNNIYSNCDIYFDNELIYQSVETRLIHNIILPSQELGEHEYISYCYYIENNTLYYETKPPITFNVIPNPPNQIEFNFNGIDFDLADKPLYVSTPCLDKGYDVGDIKGYSKEQNPNGATFRKVVNGKATFNLTSDIYEFCLIHGLVTYNTEQQTTNYEVGKIFNSIELGKFEVPNNLTTSYNINIEEFDLYEKLNPKAYGLSWALILTSLILGFIGLLTLFSGIGSNNGKITIAGVFLILSAFGMNLLENGLIGVLF